MGKCRYCGVMCEKKFPQCNACWEIERSAWAIKWHGFVKMWWLSRNWRRVWLNWWSRTNVARWVCGLLLLVVPFVKWPTSLNGSYRKLLDVHVNSVSVDFCFNIHHIAPVHNLMSSGTYEETDIQWEWEYFWHHNKWGVNGSEYDVNVTNQACISLPINNHFEGMRPPCADGYEPYVQSACIDGHTENDIRCGKIYGMPKR